MRLADMFVLPTGGDQMAIADRAFDHWCKHAHAACEHDSILDCIEQYAAEERREG